MTRSSPIPLPLSGREICEAADHACAAGPRAPGVDGRNHRDTFGGGRGSGQHIATLNGLRYHRHGYEFSLLRSARITDEFTGKVRKLGIPIYRDGIMLRALANQISRYVPLSPVDVCRSGVDGRVSVPLIALLRRQHPELLPFHLLRQAKYPNRRPLVGIKIDVANAFPSVSCDAILGSELAARMLPKDLRTALAAIYRFYSPTGVGLPLGLPTSPAMFRIGMAPVDAYLESLGAPAYRYMDDIAVLVQDPGRADKIMAGISARLAPYGLSISEKKSGAFPGEFPWLGHTISVDGLIDLSEETADRLQVRALATENESVGQVVQALAHFALASKGPRFRETVKVIQQQFGRPIEWPGKDFRDVVR